MYCFWWIWEKVELQCTCDEIIFQQSPKIITCMKWKIFSANYKLTKCFPKKKVCPLQLLKISKNHNWPPCLPLVPSSGNALVVEVHWRGGERRAELCINFWPIRYLCNYALCTMHPFSPATIPYFCNYAWQAWTFHQLPISAPHPPCLKTERSKLHQKIRNLNKEVKIAWARLQIPSTDYGLH